MNTLPNPQSYLVCFAVCLAVGYILRWSHEPARKDKG